MSTMMRSVLQGLLQKPSASESTWTGFNICMQRMMTTASPHSQATTSDVLQTGESSTPPSVSAADEDLHPSTQGWNHVQSEVFGILSQPLPLGSKRNSSLNNIAMQVNDSYFLDPNKTMQSTMRAFMVIKQVLQLNGHVVIMNNNPAFTPLMKHAAQRCTNPNLWWHTDYKSGTLLNNPKALMSSTAQPAQAALRARNLVPVNIHCPEPGVMDTPVPRLDKLDKLRLWHVRGRTQTGLNGRNLLKRIVKDEIESAQLLLPGAGNQQAGAPTLVVVIDLSYGQQVVADAYAAGIMTASVVNAHSSLERITYPIYAAEAHPQYIHFFLNWLLKTVNLPTPPRAQAS